VGVVGIFHRGKIGGCRQFLSEMCTCRVWCAAERGGEGNGGM